MSNEIRRAKKTFNVIAAALIDQLLTLFKGEQKLIFFKSEIENFAKNKKQDHVPAANYYNAMNIETEIPPSADVGERPNGGKIVVGELVITRMSVSLTLMLA
jgi:hypothetical protein